MVLSLIMMAENAVINLRKREKGGEDAGLLSFCPRRFISRV